MGLSSPVAAQGPKDSLGRVRMYVNSSGKKTFKGLVEKMEEGLPTNLFEEATKKTKGSDGKLWFDAAKIATNYVYLRWGDSKIFIRSTALKGKNVFYANGVAINESDFTNIKLVQSKLYLAFVRGLPSKKSALNAIFGVEANAETTFVEVADGDPSATAGKGAGAGPASTQEDQCAMIRQAYTEANSGGNTELGNQIAQANPDCGLGILPIGTAQPTQSNNKMGLFIFLGMLLLFLLLKNRKKNKSSGEVPEDTNGVGRDDDGHINCGGEGAQCGNYDGDGSGTDDEGEGGMNPGTPTPPPSRENYDPNQYGDIPTSDMNFKTRKK